MPVLHANKPTDQKARTRNCSHQIKMLRGQNGREIKELDKAEEACKNI